MKSNYIESISRLIEVDMKCSNGKHSLETIFTTESWSPAMYPVVRWCGYCGAIVVDGDVDCRIMEPGGYMKMQFPQVTLDLVTTNKA